MYNLHHIRFCINRNILEKYRNIKNLPLKSHLKLPIDVNIYTFISNIVKITILKLLKLYTNQQCIIRQINDTTWLNIVFVVVLCLRCSLKTCLVSKLVITQDSCVCCSYLFRKKIHGVFFTYVYFDSIISQGFETYFALVQFSSLLPA